MSSHQSPFTHPNDSSYGSLQTPDDSEQAVVSEEDQEPGPENADTDSTFGGSLLGCDTDTLASYITDYKYENGRQYHSYRDGEYWGPNDEHANELQDLAHHMYLMTLEGRLHHAPIVNPHNILDVGTGTGIWAIEMADAYPSAYVVGTDLSPTQPLFVPPNCAFEIEDCNMEWTYPKNHFDLIHIRELFGCVVDWDDFFQQAFTHTKPGGYVEILEHAVTPVSDDDTVDANHFFTKWGETVIGLGEKFGKSFTIWEESKARMEQAGFVDVVEKRYKWPMNGWPSPQHRTHGDDGGKSWKRLRELGVWNQLRLYDGVEGFMIRLLTTVGGWSYEAAQLFLAEMRINLKDFNTHAYLGVTVVYGRKPGLSRTASTETSSTETGSTKTDSSGFTVHPMPKSNFPGSYRGMT
ncbi:S-adenosyl-L-methionine-dependent methyltransferase-16 [Coleophoma cylindrospora]|uniref:S-adenosyl-L-methionine-dependent methyltransferase-16 n=1 Tax=Coleophoma cylindrospora TaxID=1849047 RepID=A0A3D8SS78_9HELO|nr:S-adenosyl-L-methionine-dependent methyltransferase-16 [Coleophoma cylindrospora]